MRVAVTVRVEANDSSAEGLAFERLAGLPDDLLGDVRGHVPEREPGHRARVDDRAREGGRVADLRHRPLVERERGAIDFGGAEVCLEREALGEVCEHLLDVREDAGDDACGVVEFGSERGSERGVLTEREELLLEVGLPGGVADVARDLGPEVCWRGEAGEHLGLALEQLFGRARGDLSEDAKAQAKVKPE